jgi:oligoribonuclease (3'-5' exoribonuclease)
MLHLDGYLTIVIEYPVGVMYQKSEKKKKFYNWNCNLLKKNGGLERIRLVDYQLNNDLTADFNSTELMKITNFEDP